MSTEHGGARQGAGRKKKTEKNETAIEQAESQIRDKLPWVIDNLLELAGGGYERIEEEWLPAGLVFIENRNEETGEVKKIKAFPNEKADKLIMVRRRVSYADKDRAANIYLADRILGKPVQKVAQTDKSGNDLEDGRPARERLASAVAQVLERAGSGEVGTEPK